MVLGGGRERERERETNGRTVGQDRQKKKERMEGKWMQRWVRSERREQEEEDGQSLFSFVVTATSATSYQYEDSHESYKESVRTFPPFPSQ